MKRLDVAKQSVGAEVVALPEESAVGLRVVVQSPALYAMAVKAKEHELDGVAFTLRFRTLEGFERFIEDAQDAADEIWGRP